MTSETRSHVAPEPIEAPEPQPVRQRDTVRRNALFAGWNTATGGEEGPISFASFVAGVETVEEYLRFNDRRRR